MKEPWVKEGIFLSFSLYIADEPLTMQSLAEAYKVSRVTIYNDKNKAVEELAERIFTTKI